MLRATGADLIQGADELFGEGAKDRAVYGIDCETAESAMLDQGFLSDKRRYHCFTAFLLLYSVAVDYKTLSLK